MTTLDVVFRYGMTPGEREMRALSNTREVYGIRKVAIDEKGRTIHVEFDASRLDANSVASLLRNAGLDIEAKVATA